MLKRLYAKLFQRKNFVKKINFEKRDVMDPQRTRRSPRCCTLSKLSYSYSLKDGLQLRAHTFLSESWRSGIYSGSYLHVVSVERTSALFDDYTNNHMTQRFHTSKWKIPHLSFCKQAFSTWTWYKIYSYVCTAAIGEKLVRTREATNASDRCSGIIQEDCMQETITEHLPRKLSKVWSVFLRRRGSVR